MPIATSGPAAPLVRAALSLVEGETAQSGRDLARARQTIDTERGERAADAAVALAVLDALRARNDDAEAAGARAERAANALASAAGVRTDPDPLLVGLVSTSKGIAAIRAGDLSVADEDFTEVTRAASPPEPLLAAESEGFLALLACFRGRLTHASDRASEALAATDRIGLPDEERPCAASLALAWVAVEQCDLPAAIGHATRASRSHFLGGDPVTRAVLALIRSRIEVARGHLPGAQSLLRAAIAEAPPDEWSTDVLHLESARVALAHGDLDLVEELLTRSSGHAEAETVLLEVQLALTRGHDLDAEAASAVAQASPALHVQVNGLLTLAAARLRSGSHGRARVAVDRALRLAAGERLRRPFHEAAPEVRELLLHDAGLMARHRWLGPDGRSPAVDRTTAEGAHDDAPPVLEQLTPKELEVLGHLAELLSTEEIASAMFVSINTVRTHVRSILRKLGVPRRNAAVRRARELELIAS